MIVFGRRAWLLAMATSVLIHVAVTVGVKLPPPGDARAAAGAPVSVSGTLAGVLGARHAATVATVSPPVEVAAARSPPLVSPKPIDAVEVRANPAVDTPLIAASPLPVVPSTVAEPVLPAQVEDAIETSSREQQSRNNVTVTQPVDRGRRVQTADPKQVVPQPAPARATSNKPKTAKSQQRAPVRSRAGGDKKGAAGRNRGGQRGRSTAPVGVMRRYAMRVRARILANRPRRTRAGRVVVTFALSRSGHLRFVRIARSSGRADLDRAAVRAVRRSAPFPRPPRDAATRQLRFSIPFRFQ